jgi:DNA-binding MarR family transcriptional regulator
LQETKTGKIEANYPPASFGVLMNPTKLNDDERTTLKNVMQLMDAFRTVRPTMPLQHAYAFLMVALDEGLGVLDYAERSGVAQTVMTRHLLDIGRQNRRREPGYGLVVQRQDPMDLRKHQTFLTPEGRTLLHKIIRSAR